jgi:hypothetical protein
MMNSVREVAGKRDALILGERAREAAAKAEAAKAAAAQAAAKAIEQQPALPAAE